ncbi:MAG: late competence development ComFB family protein [bacterium]|jgi:competence protein ComFB
MAELKNQMEELVLEAIDEYLRDRSEICDCEKCRLDMAALALNELPPRYAVTERGKVFAKISQLECQFETDILMAVIRAVEKVGNNPRY